ncbi:MAG: RNA polymerase sigma factor, partial [Roseburia sp.]|nr:RNA polymerase sigma factor [Roseburia sp.]
MDNYLQQVKRAKQGDTEAFAQLYGEIYENMYRFALYTLRHTADAEDVVSEAVVDAFASIGKLRTEEAFHSWIFRILTNKCKDKLREYCRRPEELDEAAGQAGYREGPEEAAITRKLFFELADEERLIIGMHLFCGYKTREIAEILHMNENTVRSKESRGLKKMAGEMEAGSRDSRSGKKGAGEMEAGSRKSRSG